MIPCLWGNRTAVAAALGKEVVHQAPELRHLGYPARQRWLENLDGPHANCGTKK